jgi:hypothetical protein
MPGDNRDAQRKPDMMASAVSKSMDPPEAVAPDVNLPGARPGPSVKSPRR